MKQKTIIKTEYYADDGKQFNSEEQCKLYEDQTKIPYLHLYSTIDKLDAKSVADYIDLILGQYDIQNDNDIRDTKIKNMLNHMKKEFSDYIK